MTDHKVFKADQRLQKKAGKGDIDGKAVKRAESYAKNNKVSYSDVASPILASLHAALSDFKTSKEKSASYEEIKTAVMNLKASAATFHYPLVSRLCSPLLLHLESRESIDKETLKLVELLYHIISILIRNDEEDINSAIGQELESTFLLACKKIANTKT